MTAINDENFFAFILKTSISSLALTAVAGWLFFSKEMAGSILIGGAIAIVNFIWLRTVIVRVLGLISSRPVLYAQARFILRLFLTGVAIYFALTSGWVSVAGILIGLSIVVINLVLLSIYSAMRAGG